MGSIFSSIKAHFTNKYQGVAPQRVINAVQNASAKTGVDFTFLMEKASTESGFNPSAKSKNSSASGLFQFIDNTWLSMIKKHGDDFGLGQYADQIEVKHGRCCVEDREMKKKILALRNDPEISALMAGAYTAENKAILEKNTQGEVGSTEMYLAHFMGAGGATKFINCRNYDGHAVAAKLFPHEAHANRNVFYNRETGKARTLDQVYALFDKKFTDLPDSTAAPAQDNKVADADEVACDATETIPSTLPVFDDSNDKDDIIWSDDPRFHNKGAAGFSHSVPGSHNRISPDNLLITAQMNSTAVLFRTARDKYGYNS